MSRVAPHVVVYLFVFLYIKHTKHYRVKYYISHKLFHELLVYL